MTPFIFSELSSQEKFCSIHLPFSYHVKENKTSPATTINYSGQLSTSKGLRSYHIPEKKTSKQAFEGEDVDYKNEENENGDHSNYHSEPRTEQESFAQEDEMACKDLPTNANSNREGGKRELEIITKQLKQFGKKKSLIEHLFGRATETNEGLSKERNLKESEKGLLHKPLGGLDFVPSFRSLGWPKVAREWINRERKWPSPDMVYKVIQEGFHLVVKPPKNGGNPDCDFRISFSHAEYLLSQEMNDIQRECHRCLKKYYRAYLSTEPKGLVTFHLKDILLRTIEETGAEMWTESNRTECRMKLLGNLSEALTKKELRHFFVRSYNLLCVDYIESPEIPKSLAEKVEPIMEHPMRFTKKLIQNHDSRDVRQDVKR